MLSLSFNFRKEKIIVIKPKRYQKVGARFIIWGLVPKSWLKTNFGTDYRVFVNLLDINGKDIMGSSIDVEKPKNDNWLSRIRKTLPFSTIFKFSEFNVGFIKESQGRMTIKLSRDEKKGQSIYIPIIVKQFEPEGGVSNEVQKRHGKVG